MVTPAPPPDYPSQENGRPAQISHRQSVQIGQRARPTRMSRTDSSAPLSVRVQVPMCPSGGERTHATLGLLCQGASCLPFLVGLAGVIIGWLLKTLTDLLAERRANKRADVTWRREHYVDAVGALIHAGRELMGANSSLSRAIYSLSNAERGDNPTIIESCRAGHRDAIDRQRPWVTATIQALEAVCPIERRRKGRCVMGGPQ